MSKAIILRIVIFLIVFFHLHQVFVCGAKLGEGDGVVGVDVGRVILARKLEAGHVVCSKPMRRVNVIGTADSLQTEALGLTHAISPSKYPWNYFPSDFFISLSMFSAAV